MLTGCAPRPHGTAAGRPERAIPDAPSRSGALAASSAPAVPSDHGFRPTRRITGGPAMRSAIVSLLIATAWALVPATAAAQGATTGADKGRSYAAGHFLLELEGQACGAVESATGGH